MLSAPAKRHPGIPTPHDMLEQAGGYAIELSRRGYVVMTYDYQGCASFDVLNVNNVTLSMFKVNRLYILGMGLISPWSLALVLAMR